MMRLLVYLLLSVFLISVVRSIVGVLMRGFAELFRSSSQPVSASRPSSPQAGGELKKDPVCGTFVSNATSIKKTVRGEVLHFCSADCRDKYGPS